MLYSAAEKHYCVTRKELLAIVRSIDHFRRYVYGTKFIIQNDPTAAQWLLIVQSPEGQLAHWLPKTKWYDFIFQYVQGNSNEDVDALLRTPCLCTLSITCAKKLEYSPVCQDSSSANSLEIFPLNKIKRRTISTAVHEANDTIMK